MRKPCLASIITGIFLAASTAACSLQGSGVPAEKKLKIPAFAELRINNALTAHFTVAPDAAGARSSVELTISGDDNLVPKVETIVTGDVLELRVGDDLPINPSLPLRVTATIDDLRKSRSWDAADVKVTGLANEAFVVEALDASEVDLAGTTSTLTIAASDSANVRARPLAATDVTVDSRDASIVDVCARGVLDVSASESADVSYFCSPKEVERNVRDAADVEAGD